MIMFKLHLAIGFWAIRGCSIGMQSDPNLAMPPDAQVEDEAYLLQTQTQFKSRVDRTQSANQLGGFQRSKMTGEVVTEPPIDVDNTNIVFVKLPKCASTSASGVTRRIAAHHNLTGVFSDRVWMADAGEPGVFAYHGAMDQQDFGPNPNFEGVFRDDLLPNISAIEALKLPTFLWTVVRKPPERALSAMYYKADTQKREYNAEDKLDFLQRTPGNFMFKYVRATADDTLDDVFSMYGLVGTLERFDESLVVLAAMLNVPLSDVLYVSSKNSSTNTVIQANAKHDAFVASKHPSLDEEPEVIKTYINTTFRESNALDFQLYERADRTLDQKIAEMNLQPAIEKFKKFLAASQNTCETSDPESTPCYHLDQGCNYKCFDQFDAVGLQMCDWCTEM